jgi:hypothetical protein
MPKKPPPTRFDFLSQNVDLKTVLMLVGWVVTAVGLYYGMAAKIDIQSVRIEGLIKQSDAQGVQLDAQQKAIIDLTVTLRSRLDPEAR